jgi:hypothetical protein
VGSELGDGRLLAPELPIVRRSPLTLEVVENNNLDRSSELVNDT